MRAVEDTMKRIISVCALVVLAVACGYCETQPTRRWQMPVIGVIGKYQSLSISPIMIEKGAWANASEGMPFDVINDSQVQSGMNPMVSRKIATWNLITNYYPVTLKITVDPLRGIFDQSYTIDYTLFIGCLYYYLDASDNSASTNASLTVSTNNGESGSTSIVLDVPQAGTSGSYISIAGNPIRLRLDTPSEMLRQLPDDEYRADVTFLVTSE